MADAIEAQRRDCWRRFLEAADAAIAGNHEPARRYLADIESRLGPEIAARSRAELWAYVKARTGVDMT